MRISKYYALLPQARSKPTTKNKEENPKLIDIKRISKQDLKRLISATSAYTERVKKRDAEINESKEKNKVIKSTNEKIQASDNEKISKWNEWEANSIRPLEQLQKNLRIEIRNFELGFISNLLGVSSIEFNGRKVSHEAQGLIKKLEDTEKKINLLIQTNPRPPRPKMEQYNKIPSPYKSKTKRIILAGVETLVDLSLLDTSVLKKELANREYLENQKKEAEKTEKEKQKKNKKALMAKIAKTNEERRKNARRIPGEFSRQLEIFPRCPYCQKPFKFEESHLDHIYPVSKGGLSISENLIFVCISCNKNKRDMTLRKFIISESLNETEIHKTLDALEKDY